MVSDHPEPVKDASSALFPEGGAAPDAEIRPALTGKDSAGDLRESLHLLFKSCPEHLKIYLRDFAHHSLGKLYARFFHEGTQPSPRFCEVLLREIKNTYPEAELTELKDSLCRQRYFFCANHAGFENHPELIAGSLLLSAVSAREKAGPVPLLTCTTLYPVNPTAPCGFLSGRRDPLRGFARHRFALMARKWDNHFLSALPALGFERVQRRLKDVPASDLTLTEKATLLKLSLEETADQGAGSFIRQSARDNSALYGRFLSACPHTELYFTDCEKISSALIAEDVLRGDTFSARLFSDASLIYTLCKSLAGHDNLWSRERIITHDPADASKAALAPGMSSSDGNRLPPALSGARSSAAQPHPEVLHQQSEHYAGNGTVLFFLHRDNGKCAPLSLKRDGQGQCHLVCPYGSLLLNPHNVAKALREGRLIPTFYLAYMSLIFDHQVSLAGGIFFSHYIRDMLAITARVLSLPLPPCFSPELIQAFVTPFKVEIAAETGTLNHAHPLLNLDLRALPPLSPALLENVLQSTVEDCLPLTLADFALDFTLTAEETVRYEKELLTALRAPAPASFPL